MRGGTAVSPVQYAEFPVQVAEFPVQCVEFPVQEGVKAREVPSKTPLPAEFVRRGGWRGAGNG